MTTVENALLQQMQKLAASISAMQGTASKDKGVQAAVSFQEMMQQSGGKPSVQQSGGTETTEKPLKDQQEEDGLEEGKLPVQEDKSEQEELKPETLTANPNMVNFVDLFRPEIVEPETAPVETVVAAIPEETIEAPNMDLEGQMPEMETQVDTSVGTEVSMQQQPTKDFGRSMEEAPAQEAVRQQEQQPVQAAQKEAAPEEHVEQTAGRPEITEKLEVKVERQDRGEENVSDETGGEVMAQEQPVFHETEAVPVKVGENYRTLDTQKPEMEKELATTINNAVQTGTERIEIHLAPQNLGSLVIEMVKDPDGVLQVVLHASNTKAVGLLNQHLDGLHTALQGYGHEEVRIEVQRGQESQEQHFKHADPDGKGQHQGRQQQERQEETPSDSREFLQKLRLGLFGADEV